MAVHVNEDGTLRNLTISLNGADDDNFSISGIKRLINDQNIGSYLYIYNCDPSDYEYIIFIIRFDRAYLSQGNYLLISTHILKGSWIQNATISRDMIYLMIVRTEIATGSARPNGHLSLLYNPSDNSIKITPSTTSWYNIDVLGLLK